MFLSLGIGFIVGVAVGAVIGLVVFMKRFGEKLKEVNVEYESIDTEYARLVECWEQLAEKEKHFHARRAQFIEPLKGKTE